MKIQTLSVVVGSNACNAKCPFCVSQMTGKCIPHNQKYNTRNLEKICQFSAMNGVSTALITGKGEPTMSKDLLPICAELNKYFPFIELQTNGYLLTEDMLACLYEVGLSTVIISMVHYDDDHNNTIYGFKKPLDLKKTIKMIHEAGLSVRLSCIMVKGYVDSEDEFNNLIKFCKDNNVEQLTIRPVEVPKVAMDRDVYDWTVNHKVNGDDLDDIHNILDACGTIVMNLAHGAKVYDYLGQNVCITNCLTLDTDDEKIRQLIIYPDGHVFYDWVYKGAILL